VRVPGRLRSDERIEVALGRSGAVAGVVVTQRLTISRTGDFSFVVPAPATEVAAAPGSQAQPGLREVGIVWQGFSPGHRVLAARVTLRTAQAAAAVPLAVAVERRGAGYRVRLTDVARGAFRVATGSASRRTVGGYLARLRALQRPDRVVAGPLVLEGVPAGEASLRTVAPLRVRGGIRVQGGRSVPVAAVLGGGRPVSLSVLVGGTAAPAVELRVDPLGPLEILPPPGRAPTLAGLQSALARAALAWQYRHFLDSPDPAGPSTATYLLRTARPAPAVVRTEGGGPGGGLGALEVALIVVGGAVVLAGATVLWAHS